MQYLLKTQRESDQRLWSKLKKLAKSSNTAINILIFQALEKMLENTDINEIENIKKEIENIKFQLKNLAKEKITPSTMSNLRTSEPVEAKYKQTNKESLVAQVKELRGNLMLKDLCKLAGIEYINQGLQKFSIVNLTKFLDKLNEYKNKN